MRTLLLSLVTLGIFAVTSCAQHNEKGEKKRPFDPEKEYFQKHSFERGKHIGSGPRSSSPKH